MFNKQKFCHVASNNRNEQKIGVFVYKTTDDLATVTASGYFNEKIIDINLHDLIIHEKYDAIDRTKVERNLLCVTERTLTNVGTTLIQSDWEKSIEQTVNQLVEESSQYVKIDGSRIMTAPLRMIAGSMRGAIAPYWTGVGFFKVNNDEAQSVSLVASIDDQAGFVPATNGTLKIGGANKKWSSVYATALNNGYDISIPVTNSADTLALKSQVDLAANSGRMITDQGLWYAKMDSATVAPAAEDGTNYADFSQVDGQGNPIIVTYNRVSGAWVQDQTITPPADYDGYVPITSKIWDIPEQAGQQGGRILWNHTSKEFTPYPTIVSFDSISVTGESTVTMPATPVSGQIVNKDYVDNAIATTVPNYQSTQGIADTTWAATLTIELADDKTIYFVDATADTAITLDTTNLTIEAGFAKTVEIHVISGGTLPVITWTGIDGWLTGSITTPTDTNATSIFVVRVQQRPTDAVPTVIANYGGAY